MPDLISHTVFSHITARLYDRGRTKNFLSGVRLFFYLGVFLPDITTRPVYIIFPATHNWIIFLHTPLATLFLCLLLAQAVHPGMRRRAFVNMIAGAGTHYLLDAFQKQITGNNFWLFPFSWHNFGFDIMWAGTFVRLIPVSLLLLAGTETVIYLASKRK